MPDLDLVLLPRAARRDVLAQYREWDFLETYAVLFTSPLYTKVMLTTVKTASIATVGALVSPIRSPTCSRPQAADCARSFLVCILVPIQGRHSCA